MTSFFFNPWVCLIGPIYIEFGTSATHFRHNSPSRNKLFNNRGIKNELLTHLAKEPCRKQEIISKERSKAKTCGEERCQPDLRVL